MRILSLLLASAMTLACSARVEPLILATTTSMSNSGFLEVLLPAYASDVRVLAVGSGRALALLGSNGAAVAITHAPEHEANVLRENPTWFYRKILYNDFLLVGPADDPAGIAGTRNAAEAMKRIIQTGHRFISRADGSGTHEREQQLWAAAGVNTDDENIVAAGAGMGQTLRIARETNAYTLTDRGTFLMLGASLQLRELVSADPRLVNTYAVIANPANEAGLRFAKWLAEGDGRRATSDALNSQKVRGFTVWPADHIGTKPEARPF